MYTYKAVNLLELDKADRDRFSGLVKNSKIFDEVLTPNSHLLAIAAYHQDTPIGLGYGYGYTLIKQGFIQSLIVLPDYRMQGIGSEIFSRLNSSFKEKGVFFLTCKFNSWEDDIESIRKILIKQNWSSPEVLVERYYFDPPTFGPDWYLAKGPALPKDYKIFPWKNINEKQAKIARRLSSQSSVLQDISPFDSFYPIEFINSLGLKKGSEVIGWMITHRIDPDTIRYSALYIHPEYRGVGPSVILLKESIRRHKETDIKNAYTEINFKRTPRYWINFVKKRLAPHAMRTEQVYLSFFKFMS